jgi:hypothetical protein
MEIDYGEFRSNFGTAGVPHIGVNWWWGTTGYLPSVNIGSFPVGSNVGGTQRSVNGTPLYEGLNVYPGGQSWSVVNGSDGIRYQMNGTNVPAGNPPPNATYWNVSNWTGVNGPPPATFDVRQFHTWSTIVLPWHGAPGPQTSIGAAGLTMQFLDGLFCGWGATWSPFASQPLQANGTGYCLSEGARQPIFYTHDQGQSIPGVPTHIDWIRVMQ